MFKRLLKKAKEPNNAIYAKYLGADLLHVEKLLPKKQDMYKGVYCITAYLIIKDKQDLKRINNFLGAVDYIYVKINYDIALVDLEKLKKFSINLIGEKTKMRQIQANNFRLQVDLKAYNNVYKEFLKTVAHYGAYAPVFDENMRETFNFIAKANEQKEI